MSRKTFPAVLSTTLATALLAACGGYSAPANAGAPGFSITIAGSAFSPLELAVPPGATVTVVNRDGMAHSVTSEAIAGDFKPGTVAGVAFDTKPFTGTATFTVPASAPDGTIIPYYCSTHLGAMATPTGTIRIAAEAQPAPGSGY